MTTVPATLSVRVSRAPAAGLAAAALLAVATIRLTGAGDGAAVQNVVLVFASIVMEALPFVLLGAFVSGLIEVFVPERWFAAVGRLPVRLQVPGAVVGGMAFPVCECGSVPVARRLILRGVHPAAGLTFMLAAPVLNPVVLLSTFVAYQGRDAVAMVVGRAALGAVVAMTAGWALGGGRAARLLVRPRSGEHDHDHDHSEGRAAAVGSHVAADFFFMGRLVVLGGALAALAQLAVPQNAISGVLLSPVTGGLILMAFAFVLSLCSEADAFVAVSFTVFPLGAQLAFLVFGPVLDVKLALLYGATFGRGFVLRLAAVAAPIALVGSLWFGAVVQ